MAKIITEHIIITFIMLKMEFKFEYARLINNRYPVLAGLYQ